ncbi:hypothetical protein AURDEDRAFT_185422 [Auricularia subglabra TFB-10046 SS5]|nr:hypothetical protein AURDEDRAFT_185422 [Auricularia subglabra TFB-10046 SS5]
MSSSGAQHASSALGPQLNSHDPWGVNQMLKVHFGLMGQYLDGIRVHPAWKPVAVQDNVPAWDKADRQRLRSLGMLESPSQGNPDFLLYQLGCLERLDSTFPEKLDGVLSGNDHVYLSNASGTGKTRMSFEILARNWGIYLSCYVDYTSDPYGSFDLSRAVSEITGTRKLNSRFTPRIPVSTRLSQTWKEALDENRRIAHRYFRCLILARMLLFDVFLQLAAERCIPDHEARHHWLMIQLRPAVLLGDDTFKVVFVWLRRLNEDAVTQITETVLPKVLSRTTYIVVDEAQSALKSCRSAFATADDRKHAPILRELIFDLDVVTEALAVSNFKQKSVRHHHSFGFFASLQQCSTYIRHFLGPGVTDEHCEMAYRWCRGRHRIIAVLVMLTMRFGTRNMDRIMDNFLRRLTGYERPGCKILHSYLITSYSIAIESERIEGLPTTARCYSQDLVHLGVALYEDSAEHAVIFEPFIFLNLARWLASSTEYGIHGIIRRRLTDGGEYPLHSVAFVEGLAPCLMAAIGSAPALEQALAFPGRKPTWAAHSARVVLPRLAHSTFHFADSQTDAVDLIHSTATPADVLVWLDHAPKPFLIPDRHLGADLLFFIEVHDIGHLLVCVHAEPFSSIRTRRHTRVVPPNSTEDFYKNEPDAQEQFLAAVNSLPRVPLDVTIPRGKPGQGRRRLAKFSTLRLLCFEQPFRDEAYDPPVAVVNFDFLLQISEPPEFSFATIQSWISDAPVVVT